MAFIPYSYDNGQPLPTEYIPAAAGNYTIGMCLELAGGKVAKSIVPTHIALCDRTGVTVGTPIPVMHISADMIFEAPLAAASSSLKQGSYVDVSTDCVSISNTASNQNLQIISLDGTDKGSLCRVRFVRN